MTMQPSQKHKKTLLEELYSLALLLGVVFVIRSSVLGLYVIPTGSMLPTIKIDDRLIANRLAYGLMLPFAETQIYTWNKPKRGDIVLFKSPKEDHTFVKRVIGVENDKISFSQGILTINGVPVKEEMQSDRKILENMDTAENHNDKTLYLESASDMDKHYMLRSTYGGHTYFDTKEYHVPPGKVFCLGDNRDGSNDSRVWGFVDVDKIYGKALYVFYSTMRHDGWLPHFRTERFFTKLSSL